MQAVNIGILGLGTVGGGTAQVLQDNAAEISKRLGREVRVTAVCTSNANRAKGIVSASRSCERANGFGNA